MRSSRRLPHVAIATASHPRRRARRHRPDRLSNEALSIADLYDPGRRVNFSGRTPGGLTWLDDRHYVERNAGGSSDARGGDDGRAQRRSSIVAPPGGGDRRPCPT